MRAFHPSRWNPVFFGHRLYLPFLIAAFYSASLHGGIQALSESHNGHVFLVEDSGGFFPVVGVVSNNKVVVLGKDQQTRTLKLDNEIRAQEKELTPVGRCTILQSKRRMQKGGLYWGEPVFNKSGTGGSFREVSPSTSIDIELVADRDIPSAYLVLIELRGDSSSFYFLPLGDLPQGKAYSKTIEFSDYKSLPKWRYKFEIYSGGNPVELHNLFRVVERKDSQSLNIPWLKRLDAYLLMSERRGLTRPPSVFHISFDQLNTSALNSRGIDQLNLVLSVDMNGRVEILENDPSLTPEEARQLVSDTAAWQLFPAFKEGKAEKATITLPLKL